MVQGYVLSPHDKDRIQAMLRWYERQVSGPARMRGQTPQILSQPSTLTLRLTSVLAPYGTATGKVRKWNGSGYTEGDDDVDVVDYNGNFGLGSASGGEVIEVRKRMVSSATKYEALSSGQIEHDATMDDELTYGAETHAPAHVLMADGETTMASVEVYGKYLADWGILSSGDLVGIRYNNILGRWHVVNARSS